MGFVGIGMMFVVAGILVQIFDLEEESTNLNGAQKVAGYFVIIFICFQMSLYALLYA